MNNYGKKIVVIDDEQHWTQQFKELLNNQGYKHVDTVDGKSIVFEELLGGYDLAIVDITMPIIDGFQVKNYLKIKSPRTKVIMTSQHDTYGLGIVDKVAGADGWMEKRVLQEHLVSFFLLVDRLLTDDKSIMAKQNILEGINVITVINEIGTSALTPHTVELEKELNQLHKEIADSNIANKKDASINVKQIALELAKKDKDKITIMKLLENVNKYSGQIASIGVSIGKIADMINKFPI